MASVKTRTQKNASKNGRYSIRRKGNIIVIRSVKNKIIFGAFAYGGTAASLVVSNNGLYVAMIDAKLLKKTVHVVRKVGGAWQHGFLRNPPDRAIAVTWYEQWATTATPSLLVKFRNGRSETFTMDHMEWHPETCPMEDLTEWC